MNGPFWFCACFKELAANCNLLNFNWVLTKLNLVLFETR